MKPKKSHTALLIIDMINPLDFPEGKSLLRHARPVARNIRRLKKTFKKKNWPVIYLNDHYGHWRDDWQSVYEYCTQKKFPGHVLGEELCPEDDDYFILKPKHSGFFGTQLDILLKELEVKKLILTGIAGNICVLFTANDAHMRGYDIHVPANGTASNTKKDNDFSLRQLRDVLEIETKEIPPE